MTISSVCKHAVDHDTEDLAADLSNDNKALVGLAAAELQDFLQIDERQQSVAQAQHRCFFDALDAVIAGIGRTHKLEHRKLRDGETLAAGLDDQR